MDKEDKYRREFYFRNFINKFLKYPESPKQEDIDYYIQRAKEIESMTHESKRFYVLLDHTTFSPVYLSKNTELESGYSNDYIINGGVNYFLNLFTGDSCQQYFNFIYGVPKQKRY